MARARIDKQLRTVLFFFARLDGLDDDSACWLWTGTVLPGGYGQLKILGRHWQAHRFAFALQQDIPDGLQVNHSCDIRRCCNPKHLHLGTPLTNMAEATARGRMRRGEGVTISKLNKQSVLSIRAASGSQQSIADKFGVSQAAVSHILLRKTWKHI